MIIPRIMPSLRPFYKSFKTLRLIVPNYSTNCICEHNKSANTVRVFLFPYRTLTFNHRKTKKAKMCESNDADCADLASKTRLISELNFDCDKDAQPFTKLPIRTLLHIYKTTKNDEKNGYCRNRIYYIANLIQCPSSIVSERLAQRTFIYSLSFDWLRDSLSVLLEFGVSSDRLLRDLWVLKYHHATIRERLQRVKDLGIDTLYPWMVRCSEEILKRSICISKEAKDILGETKSTQVYLANRLNVSPDAVEDMCFKIPALKTIRVTKVKSFLDFLLKEGFDVEDIANKPRVLTASQKTVERRLEKLRKLGLSEINLNVLCRSKKDFRKYYESVNNSNTDNT